MVSLQKQVRLGWSENLSVESLQRNLTLNLGWRSPATLGDSSGPCFRNYVLMWGRLPIVVLLFFNSMNFIIFIVVQPSTQPFQSFYFCPIETHANHTREHHSSCRFSSSYILIFLFFVFFRPHLWHKEVPRLGVESELQLLAYDTAAATWDPSRICDSSWQPWILSPLSEAMDQTLILMDPSRVHYC